ncbi:MAG: NHL repeat-containing protein [Acidobacteria bacterium]|nr:NHL repeat-containing protein [Acidobacteriota bacterium]
MARKLYALVLAVVLCTLLAAFAPFDPFENSLIVTDHNHNSGGTSPCTGPGRLIRIRNSNESGWDSGPTVAGLTFNNPYHFSFDASGQIYIADRDNRRVVRMGDVAGNGWKEFSGVGSNLLSNLGTRTGCTQSNYGVYATAIDSAGRIYISTSNPGKLVRVNDMDGAGWISFDLNSGNFRPARNVTLDSQSRIYLTDNQNHRIIRMNDMTGDGLVTYGSIGNGVGQFYEPESIAFDSQGRIYISDENNHRVIRINDMTGAGWTTYGSYGSSAGQLSHPHGLAFDSLGRLYISDTLNARIVRVNSIEGGAWIAIGNKEILGRDLDFAATKAIGVFGRGPALSSISILPQVAIGGTYQTTIIGMNTGAAGVDAEFLFLKTIPPPCAGIGDVVVKCAQALTVKVGTETGNSFSRTVAPMGIVRLDATSDGNLAVGYARIRATDELNSLAMFRTFSGNTIQSEAGVNLSGLVDHFTIYIDNTNNAQSGYAIVNPLAEGIQPPSSPGIPGGWVNLTAKLRDKNGVLLDTQSLQMSPGSHVSEFASQRFPRYATAGFEGSIEFDCTFNCTRASAVALRYDNPAADVFTTIPVVFHVEDPSREPTAHPYLRPVRTTTLYFAQVADGSTYRTNFILVNPTNSAAAATLEFYSDTGSPLSLPIGGTQRTTYQVSLAARGVARIATDGTSSGIAAGWARVTSATEGIGGSAIFQTVTDARIASEAGVSASSAATRFAAYVDTLGFADSGVALSNPDNSNVNVTLNLRNPAGQLVASTTRTLPAMGHLARMVTQLFPSGFDEFEGTLEVLASGGPVTGVALRYDNPGGTIFSTTPIVVIR